MPGCKCFFCAPRHDFRAGGYCPAYCVKILVQVKYGQQQKYVKLDEDEGQFDFRQFHEKVIKRFACHRMLKLHTRMQQGPKLMPNIQRPRWTRQCAADSFLRSGIL
ncbi:unnamed protein product [Arctogadus glacialis]